MSERQKKRLANREANKLKRRMIEKVLSGSRTGNLAFNLNFLVDGWLELESDPGTFSLLIEDFGCCGAQVDEIYDLEQKIEGPVFGFIFLFKWLNNQQSHNDRSRNQKSSYTSSVTGTTNNSSTSATYSNNSYNKIGSNNNTSSSSNNNSIANANANTDNKEQIAPEHQRPQWSYVEDENIISEMFFAKQMISNSCATHALISILLNCDYDELNLGPTLTRLKEHTKVMNPENKGHAIGNLPELAKAHNSHASFSSLYNRNKASSHSGMSYVISGNQRTNLQQQNKHEAYHFVSYVPINNRLYELDGLKNYPIDHGPFGPHEDWTEKFRTVIKQRLSSNKSGDDPTISNDIRYNLMAVVPDKRVCLRAQLRKLRHHHKICRESINRLTKRVSSPLSIDIDIPNPPYSPLSNGTLTASEAGSEFNSPTRMDETFLSDDDETKIDKYFFIKFDQQNEPTSKFEDEFEPAHKNCIINIESTNVHPINLTINTQKGNNTKEEVRVGGDELEDKSGGINISNNNNSSSSDNNDINCKSASNTSNGSSTVETDKNENLNREKKDLKLDTKNLDADKLLPTTIRQGTQTNGLTNSEGETRINDVPAHNGDKKYNLSSKPPFDFNILDEMQHVHFGKSTLKDMKVLSQRLSVEIGKVEALLKEEIDKRRKYKIDNSRRTHNYEPFIMTFLSMLATQGNLADLIEKDLGIITPVGVEETQSTAVSSTATATAPVITNSICKTQKPSSNPTNNKVSSANGGSTTTSKSHSNTPKAATTTKPKYKYVSTGRPVGRPRKNPLVPPAVKAPPSK